MCDEINALDQGMVADRQKLTNVSVSGSTVTSTGSFSASDVGKTIVLYDSIYTDFPGEDFGSTLPPSPSNGKIFGEGSATPYTWKRYTNEGSPVGWVQIKPKETIATTITAFIDSDNVTVSYSTFPSGSGLTAVLGTDNFSHLQTAIDYCLNNGKTLCIPDGDYMILFENSNSSKNRIRLNKVWTSAADNTSLQIRGTSKHNTKLYYEYAKETIDTSSITTYAYGLGIDGVNNADFLVNVSLEDFSIIDPEYTHKLIEQAPFRFGSSFFEGSGELNITNVNINGVTVGFEMNEQNTNGDVKYKTVNIRNCNFSNCVLRTLGCFSGWNKLNVKDSEFVDVGLLADETLRKSGIGDGLYAHRGNTFRFDNCLFDNVERHAIKSFSSGNDFTANGVLYQEIYDCKFISCGTSVLVDEYCPLSEIRGCIFSDDGGIDAKNTVLITDCLFGKGSVGVYGTTPPSNFPISGSINSPTESNDFYISILNSTFYRTAGGITFNESSNANKYYQINVDSCKFIGETNGEPGNVPISLYGHETKITNCSFSGRFGGAITLWDKANASIIGNIFRDISKKTNRGTIGFAVINDTEFGGTVFLKDNEFYPGDTSKPVLRLSNNTVDDVAITGEGNFFSVWNSFDNTIASGGSPQFQNLRGRRGQSPTTLNTATSNFVTDITFNFDFYKVEGTGVINDIAFNGSSSLTTSGVGLFCGTIRLLSVDGFTLSNTAGNIRTGTGANYTAAADEVVELYYDSATQKWYKN